MAAPPRVFISATSADLRHIREIVRGALIASECLPLVQEDFGPDYRDVSGMLREKIGRCDALIHIAGMRYGAEPDPSTLPLGTERRSYTQMEWALARELKLEKVFTFVCPEDFPYLTVDDAGQPLAEEPAELRELQAAHRQRLLQQKELRYRVKRPEDFATRVREIQLELSQIRGEVRRHRRNLLWSAAAVALSLLLVSGGVLWVRRDLREMSSLQAEQAVQDQLRRQTERVIQAYQERFREIRNDLFAKMPFPNREIDERVRAELPALLELKPELVTSILDVEAPRVAAAAETPVARKLAALFVLGDYDAVLTLGESRVVDTTVSALRTMGDAALAKFAESPDRQWKEEAVRYYRACQALVSKVDDPVTWADVTMDLARALQMLDAAQWDEAGDLFEDALATRTEVLGRSHPDTGTSLNNLAHLRHEQSRFDQAEALYREALAMFGKDGLDDPSRLTIVNNLGGLLHSRGDLDGALPLLEEAVEGANRTLGPDDPDSLGYAANLAMLLADRGEPRRALADLSSIQERQSRVLGPDHPDTLSSTANLAALLRLHGRTTEAEPLYRKAVDSGVRVHGENHPDVLKWKRNLAEMLLAENNLEEAEALLADIAERSARILGPEDIHTLETRGDLACIHLARGELNPAEGILREILGNLRLSLGNAHPQTIATIGNLAEVRRRQGDLVESEALFREILAVREAVDLPPRETLMPMHSYGVLLANQERLEESRQRFQEVLEGAESAGLTPREYLRTAEQLALVQMRLGHHAEMEALLFRIIELQKAMEGGFSPLVRSLSSDLADIYMKQGRHAEAETWGRRIIDVLFPFHPDGSSRLHLIDVISRSLLARSQQDSAVRFLQEQLRQGEEVLGVAHAVTLTMANHLVVLLAEVKEFKEAEELARVTLERRRADPAATEDDLLESLFNLGSILGLQGRNEEAAPFYEEAVAGYLRNAEEVGKLPLQVLAKYGDFLEAMGVEELESGERMIFLARANTPHSSKTLSSLVNLIAGNHYVQGNYQAAAIRFREAVDLYRQQVDGVSQARQASINLGNSLLKAGELVEAGAVLNEVLIECAKDREPDHASLAMARFHLARCDVAADLLQDAESNLKRTLEHLDHLDGERFKEIRVEALRSLEQIRRDSAGR